MRALRLVPPPPSRRLPPPYACDFHPPPASSLPPAALPPTFHLPPPTSIPQAAADLPNAKALRSPRLHTTRPGIRERLIDCGGIAASDESGWDRENAWCKRVEALLGELQAEPFQQVLILCSTVGGCKRLHRTLEGTYNGESGRVLSLHWGLDPEERTAAFDTLFPPPPYLDSETDVEELATRRAANGPPTLLLSTERAMRGLDLPELSHVFLFDFPREVRYVPLHTVTYRYMSLTSRERSRRAAVEPASYGSFLSLPSDHFGSPPLVGR